MRGKAKRIDGAVTFVRITPAYAGKSYWICLLRVRFQDHPRLCGEKLSIFAIVRANSGSPPPMRGKVVYMSNHVGIYGITPAYAGKSLTCRRFHRSHQDHPRLCGEKLCQHLPHW